jgi:hypothetical protein
VRRAALVLALLFFGTLVRADDVVKRPVPDYDGRGDDPTTAGDVLVWVPRIIVSPIYLVTEFIIRRPMKALVVWVEDVKLVERAFDFFGIGKPLGFVPTFYFDLASNPHFGIYFFWDAGPNSLRFSGSAGVNFLSATLRDRVTIAENLLVGLRLHGSNRSDALFYGIGPLVNDDRPSRYEIRRLEVSGSLEWGPVGRYIGLQVGERDIEFGTGSCCNDPSLAEAVANGYFPTPFGFADGGFRGPFGHLRLTLDSRPSLPNAGVGATFDGEIGSDTIHDRSWARFGGQASASIDPVGGRRVLTLTLGAQFAEPLSGPDVPFTELVGLGGFGPLPAFAPGQLIGRSAVDATLTYEWPIWIWLVGAAHVAVGNVFGDHLSDFDANLLRLSVGLGIRSVGSVDHRFQFLFALGTAPFSTGGSIDSVRLVFGGVTGF